MRIFKLVHQITSRFADMDESELNDLYGEAQHDYKEALARAKAKEISNTKRATAIAKNNDNPQDGFVPPKEEKFTVADRAVLLAEKWYVRYGIAISYIVIVPLIRDYMNGGEDMGQDEESEMMEFAQAYAKMKNMRKA